ncbi:ly6/PLAUR domain-containing protein 8 [Camelus ferus]|nr:ly6/PLAUR domain-containing protein 8 [Camelus ferus]
MKGFLVAGITALLTVAAVGVVSAEHSHSVRAAPGRTTLCGGNFMFYQNSACSARNCSGLEAYTFSVHTANENFVFASQCCQGGPCGNVTVTGETSKLVLKGCSNINDATCHILSTKKPKLGEFTLQKLVCADKSTTASTTKNPKTIAPHRPTSGTGSKVFFTPVALASLLLLGLLL